MELSSSCVLSSELMAAPFELSRCPAFEVRRPESTPGAAAQGRNGGSNAISQNGGRRAEPFASASRDAPGLFSPLVANPMADILHIARF